MRNFGGNISDDDIMASRDFRNSTINRPDIDPGMGDDDEWESSGLSSDSDDWGGGFRPPSRGMMDDFDEPGGSFGMSGMGGMSSMGGGMGMGGMNGLGGMSSIGGFSQQYGMPGGQQNVGNQYKSEEDIIFDKAVAAGKNGINFIKEMIESFSSFDLDRKIAYGRNLFITGLVGAGIGVLGFFLKFPFVLESLVSSLISAGLGSIIFMSSMDKAQKMGVLDRVNNQNSGFEEDEDDFDNSSMMSNDMNDEDSWGEDEDEENEDLMGSLDISGLEDEEDEDIEPKASQGFQYIDDDEPGEEIDTDAILEKVDSSNGLMMTRQFLYDTMSNCLESKTRNFSDTVELDEDSREFLGFCSMIEKASNVVGGEKAKEPPQLISAKDKLFYTLLEIQRPRWINASNFKNFITEIVNICSFNTETYERDDSVTGSGELVGDMAYVKLMKGETALVTVKDAYASVKDQVLNVKNQMPVVLGIDAEGRVVFQDFKDVHGMLVAGAPRSGKSWCVKAILGQLMMYKKPSELEIYTVDPKNLSSDFFTLETPHVRGFISSDEELLQLLNHLCTVEAAKREQMLFQAGGFKNISDFHAAHPEIDLPYIIVVIDEILTISQRMDKETRTEFFGYLKQFVSRLPGYGIRLFMVPHLVKNSVVDKSVTDMLPNRIIVKGSSKDIEDILDVKKNEFPYKLAHTGDMGVKLDSASAKFVHSIVISGSNEGYDRFFDFLTNFWLKLEPTSFKGSKLQYDIQNGYKKLDDFPILKDSDKFDEDLFEPGTFKSVYEDIKLVREEKPQVTRPQRPKRPKKEVEDVDEEEEVSRPQRPKRPKNSKLRSDEDIF